MNEIIFTTVAGLVVGYIIKHQLCPRHINQLEGSLKIQSEKVNTENQRLIEENRMLKDPKRLINEYEGGEGSSTGELLQTMRQSIESLEQSKKNLNTDITNLRNEKKELYSGVEELKRKLNSELQDAYDSAIDFLNKQLEKARTLGATGTKQTISKLEKKRDELGKKDK
jgi:chromosome segregation ATPase